MECKDSIFHALYYAKKLSLNETNDDIRRISQTLYSSKISLNPHQIESALFCFNSPFQKGYILADEVGLGKTIEAGIVIAQNWCERKRKILIICPASLVKQWQIELYDKFSLYSEIMDRKAFNSYIKKGYDNPFDIKDKIYIASINFISKETELIKLSNLDLVVLDEAHKLRNVYSKTSNPMAKEIRDSIRDKKKVLLTATPFQNSLLELYGLLTFVDNEIFGDVNYFKYKYIKNYEENRDELVERLKLYVKRTLRNQVEKYIKYSKRITSTFEFFQTDIEDNLYEKITDLILDVEFEKNFGKGRAHLIILIFRKLLSSSTFAVLGTLKAIKKNIENKEVSKIVELADDELLQEMEGDDVKLEINEVDVFSQENIKYLNDKIDKCINIAENIKIDTKTEKLLEAIEYSFIQISTDKNRNKKILIFTESRRTQDYLFNVLIEKGYDKVLKFNGTNTDKSNNKIFEVWKQKQNLDILKENNKNSNMRQALLDAFKSDYEIMIATEAAAEGLNMQFCSIIINYDLPWNPQRIEQRIGRCHRYGQKNDVIIINMLNSTNIIDRRIYELLNQKLHLFNDVFGSSDEVLGRIESSDELQNLIIDIYKSCRSPEKINIAFDELQKKYKEDIDNKMLETRRQLIDNFDEDIQQKFDNTLNEVNVYLKEHESNFWRLLRYTMYNKAHFEDKNYEFNVFLDNNLMPKGKYSLLKNITSDNIICTLSDRYGQRILKEYLDMEKVFGYLEFDLTNYQYKLSELEKYKNKIGKIKLSKIKISSFENEEYLVMDGILENGESLDQETCQKLFRLYASKYYINEKKYIFSELLENNHKVHLNSIIKFSSDKSVDLFSKQSKQINEWAEDMIGSIQFKANVLREKRKEKQKELDYAITISEQEGLENEISELTKKIKKMWLELSSAEDEVEEKRNTMIKNLKKEQMKIIEVNEIFNIDFMVV